MDVEEVHYIFVLEISNEDTDEVPELMDKEMKCICQVLIVSSVHYRFILEEEMRELQLDPCLPGKGVGKFLMKSIELIALKVAEDTTAYTRDTRMIDITL